MEAPLTVLVPVYNGFEATRLMRELPPRLIELAKCFQRSRESCMSSIESRIQLERHSIMHD